MALDEDTRSYLSALAEMGIELSAELPLEELRAMAAMSPPGQTRVHEAIDLTLPGPVGPMTARLYRPREGTALPMLVYMHGGGWSVGTLDNTDECCRMLSLTADCLILSINYPLAPENKFPIATEAAYQAFNWAVEKAIEFDGDPTRVAIGGDSAGANLSAAVCLMARDRETAWPRMQLLIYPATDYRFDFGSMAENAGIGMLSVDGIKRYWQYYMRDPSDACNPYLAPAIAASHANLPPAFIIVAEHDPLRDDGIAYGELLKRAGTIAEVRQYDGVIHGFMASPLIIGKAREAIDDAAMALKKVFAMY